MNSIYYIFSMIAFIVILRTNAIDDTHIPNGCAMNCSTEYNLICGTDDAGTTKTFSNDCIMKLDNCVKKTNYQKTADGPCP